MRPVEAAAGQSVVGSLSRTPAEGRATGRNDGVAGTVEEARAAFWAAGAVRSRGKQTSNAPGEYFCRGPRADLNRAVNTTEIPHRSRTAAGCLPPRPGVILLGEHRRGLTAFPKEESHGRHRAARVH